MTKKFLLLKIECLEERMNNWVKKANHNNKENEQRTNLLADQFGKEFKDEDYVAKYGFIFEKKETIFPHP